MRGYESTWSNSLDITSYVPEMEKTKTDSFIPTDIESDFQQEWKFAIDQILNGNYKNNLTIPVSLLNGWNHFVSGGEDFS